jgi:hypothetical protein
MGEDFKMMRLACVAPLVSFMLALGSTVMLVTGVAP